jgi:hypothetical protein
MRGESDDEDETLNFPISLTISLLFLSANQFTFSFRSVIYYVLFIPHASPFFRLPIFHLSSPENLF